MKREGRGNSVMKLIGIFSFLLVGFVLMASQLSVSSQILVHSLSELKPYLDADDVNVVLAPGVYSITSDDIKKGDFGSTDFEDRAKILLLFSGHNSTYDFTGVTLNIETAVFRMFGDYRVHELVITGSDNVLKNLTMIDVGSVYDGPSKGALGVCMDGRDNRVEEFHMTVKGSFPYGYGDAFGKGKKNVIRHQKHSAFLIRGLRNYAKNDTIIHRSYGHCMFMQAASYPTIEGCCIEGKVRTTDDMLAETSGPAFDVGFMTAWGYKLPAGYMLSLGEAGIRAYDGGSTIVDGEIFKRGTDNPTVVNCTIKYMRTGVTLAHATGKKHVDGCTAIGCENGFSLGHGDVLNCKADCVYGPVYSSTYARDKGYNADITIIPGRNPYYNGSGTVAYIGGSGHSIILRSSSDAIALGLSIKVGGEKGNIRLMHGNFPNQNDFKASDLELTNLTHYPVLLSSKSAHISGQSKGIVTDDGTNNSLK